MKPTEQKRFDALYEQHLRGLKLHGYSASTIDVYSRAVRRLATYYDCVPDHLSVEQLEVYFAALVDSHSWATVRVDRNGLQFFWKYVLKQDWRWLEIIKAPKIRSLPDILTPWEVERVIGAARKLRYRVFILTTYSMGLRLSETLALEVGDIDAGQRRVHIRRGKGHNALRALWARHRHPRLLFPNCVGSPEHIRQATTHMDRGGTQKAMKVLLAECGIKKRSPFIPCVTALPPICWNAA